MAVLRSRTHAGRLVGEELTRKQAAAYLDGVMHLVAGKRRLLP
jgi:hypothetical protein